jgi:hypothetical protein
MPNSVLNFATLFFSLCIVSFAAKADDFNLKALPINAEPDERTRDIVNMQKTIYSVLGQYEIPEIVSRFKPEFQRLDTDGTLSNVLDSLYEMRMLDMQISIQHAKKMRGVLDWFGRRGSS